MSVCKIKSEKSLFPTEGADTRSLTDRHDRHTERSFCVL